MCEAMRRRFSGTLLRIYNGDDKIDEDNKSYRLFIKEFGL